MSDSDQSGLKYLKTYAKRCNASLQSLAIEKLTADPYLFDLREPIIYVLEGGGKRIRPALVYATAEAIGIKSTNSLHRALDYVACAIELIHTYSLIHDDLPAMDNDDLRRGRPTLHKAYDDATAILIGDGLQAKAFELIANAPEISATQRLKILQFVCKAIGFNGMVAGQYFDVQATGKSLNIEQLKSMHTLKTGALLTAAVVAGGITADASEKQLTSLEKFGNHIGLAFQVTDDILDVEGTAKKLGKTPGKDAKAKKSTYVNLLGLAEAKRFAINSLDESLRSLNPFGTSAKSLRKVAELVIYRTS